ncbi:EAL domain-containing protein [Ruminococcus sp.]|uniref:EAL domain-containing protein n=1 Tax=Ruminococcus sp. TaxID=41978 RepID=UPI001B404ABE|nr:EAL domain-containing protein [Ruminococcus sp.]MBP5433524.1 EAL domain-containing protein [Ruminococcus sp.]
MISEKERNVFEGMAIPQILLSYNNGKIKIELVSDSFCNMTEIDRDSIQNNVAELVHPDDLASLSVCFLKFVEEHSNLDVMFRVLDKKRNCYILIHGTGLWQLMEDGTEMILFYFDDTRRIQNSIRHIYSCLKEKDPKAEYNDAVTGLPNLKYMRRFADEKLNSFGACITQQVLIYIGVKSMRSYNDRYGYDKGDALMLLIAKTIKEEFPSSFCGRAVEDHFVIMDEFYGYENVINKINSINQKIKKNAYGITEGIRAGAYVVNPEIKAMNAFDHVRQALKDIGKDMNVICRFYSDERDGELLTERHIIESFEEAMEKKMIRVFYHPIICTKTLKIYAIEALARWIDPLRGMISPGEFIPVLSRYHLLYKLDLYMVEQVCREFEVRKKSGLPLIPVTVNISAQDFDYVDVPGKLRKILEEYGIDSDNIIVEITEQDIAKGTDSFKKQLCSIRENGYRLWIDDFGSGYSSLNVLGQYDIDRIKFDMAFLRHIDDNNGKNRRIMKAIVNMCRELEIHTLAEGVETESQLEFLQEIECELAQGFYFSYPKPIEETKKG